MSRTLTLFDLDGTLLSGDSDDYWIQFLIEEGLEDAASARAANAAIIARYRDGSVGQAEFVRFYLRTLKGRPLAQLVKLRDTYMQRKIRPRLRAAGKALVARHSAEDELIALTTATNRFLIELTARELGFAHAIAVEPECRGDQFTGNFSGPINFKEGKVECLDAWLAARGERRADFAQIRFYSDSRNDLPLLSAVSHPVAVDPDATLRAYAEKNGWPIISLADPPGP